MTLPADWPRTATEADVLAVEEMCAAARERLAAEPRPDVMYVADVPADGSVEIRWWVNANYGWRGWTRVTDEVASARGQGWRYFDGPDMAFHRDEVVQVRPVMDMQTGQTLGQVA